MQTERKMEVRRQLVASGWSGGRRCKRCENASAARIVCQPTKKHTHIFGKTIFIAPLENATRFVERIFKFTIEGKNFGKKVKHCMGLALHIILKCASAPARVCVFANVKYVTIDFDIRMCLLCARPGMLCLPIAFVLTANATHPQLQRKKKSAVTYKIDSKCDLNRISFRRRRNSTADLGVAEPASQREERHHMKSEIDKKKKNFFLLVIARDFYQFLFSHW